jgi:hypothetical protein
VGPLGIPLSLTGRSVRLEDSRSPLRAAIKTAETDRWFSSLMGRAGATFTGWLSSLPSSSSAPTYTPPAPAPATSPIYAGLVPGNLFAGPSGAPAGAPAYLWILALGIGALGVWALFSR